MTDQEYWASVGKRVRVREARAEAGYWKARRSKQWRLVPAVYKDPKLEPYMEKAIQTARIVNAVNRIALR